MSIWDRIKSGVKETFSLGVVKTEELTKIGKIKFEIVMLKRNIKDELAKMGSLVYEKQRHGMMNEIFELQEYVDLFDKIRKLEMELHHKEDQLELINIEKEENKFKDFKDLEKDDDFSEDDIDKIKEELSRLEKKINIDNTADNVEQRNTEINIEENLENKKAEE